MAKIRVGIVGWGEIARFHLRHLQGAGARVTGILSRRAIDPGVPVFRDLDALLRHCDALTIAVPNHLHARICSHAVEAGKPVLVEKPLCISESELSGLEKTLLARKIPVAVGCRLRWNPALRRLRESRRDLSRVSCTYVLGIDKLAPPGKEWTLKLQCSGGAFLILGVHSLDLARWLARAGGEPLSRFSASAGPPSSPADFPLQVSLSGVLPCGIGIEAGADLRPGRDFKLELEIESERGIESNPCLAHPGPEEPGAADVEYRSMMEAFLGTVEKGQWRPDEIREIIQTHKELLRARKVAPVKKTGLSTVD